MTEEKKDILIGKMVDAPDTLTDQEVETILNDDELMDIYNTSSEIRRAYMRQPEIDVDAEWLRFRPNIKRKISYFSRALRVAAVFTGAVILAGIAVHFGGTPAHETEQIDIDEYLRVQKARIDNDIAMQAAEMYTDEYRLIINRLSDMGIYDGNFDNAIARITIQ